MKPIQRMTRSAAFGACLLLAAAGSATAQCNCVYAARCTITSNIADFVGAPERTFCTVRTTSSRYSVAYELTTPSGEQYRIENPLTMFDGWFINSDPGIRVATGDPARPCYRTPRIQICLDP